ncbi:hypothetical protein [Streptomyces sp. NPDC015130]|uniref:hypothetical protein n=1 Tax=Streptomyces sp. NPDC015130 TaxID=3364940 RepID=UPI0036FFB062
MDDVRGTVRVTLYGPAETFDKALAALHAAGITAERDDIELAALIALFHEGTSRPSGEFLERCKARAGEAVAGTGFVADRVGIWESNAATRMLTFNRNTGEYLGEFVDTEAPLYMRNAQLHRLAQEKGISVNDIELRDPAYLTPPTE